jgi:predicted esterase
MGITSNGSILLQHGTGIFAFFHHFLASTTRIWPTIALYPIRGRKRLNIWPEYLACPRIYIATPWRTELHDRPLWIKKP